ncbi:MAG: hypothetical protein LBP19_05330 [Treponema sp.]|jgi:phage-related protein|nr:hypothetical protein [Treponema sp.]
MAEESEVTFNFDITPFMNGLKQVSQGFTKTFSDVAKIGKSIANAIITPFQILKKEALNAMPIVGQMIDFAKDVITRNLFAPLQRELIPILQKIMKWITDNRTMFVKWRQVIANVFKGIWEFAKILFDVVKSIIDMITRSLMNHFGGAFASIEELVNTIVWKVTMIMLFLAESFKSILPQFQPLIDTLTNYVSQAVGKFVEIGSSMLKAFNEGDNFKKLIEAVNSAMQGIASVIDAVVTGISNLIIQLLLPDEAGNTFGDVVKSLGDLALSAGQLLASGITGFFEGFNKAIDPVSTTLKNIVDKFNELVKMLDESGTVKKAFEFFGRIAGNILMAALTLIETSLNTLTTRFKQLNVLLDSTKNFSQKLAEIERLEGENTTANNTAWGRVEMVKEANDAIQNVVADAINSLPNTTRNMAEEAVMNNPDTKAIYTGNEQIAREWFLQHMSPEKFKDTRHAKTFNYTYDNMFKEIALAAAAEADLHKTNNNTDTDAFMIAFKKNVESRNLLPVNDAIITKSGKIIQTAPDDNIYAFKNLGSIAPPLVTQRIVQPAPVFPQVSQVNPAPIVIQAPQANPAPIFPQASAQVPPPPRAEPEITPYNTRSTQSRPAPVTIQFGDVSISVPEGSTAADAQQTGMAAAEGFASRLAQELSMNLLREGA